MLNIVNPRCVACAGLCSREETVYEAIREDGGLPKCL